jgi:hypothetical protein
LWYTVFSLNLLLKLDWVDRVQYKNLYIHITRQNIGKLLQHVASGIILWLHFWFNKVILRSCFPPLFTVCLDEWYKKQTQRNTTHEFYCMLFLHF